MNHHLRSLCVVVFHSACVVLASGANPALARTVDLASAGAIPGDPTPITALLQRLIDEVSAAGGGTVVVPTGTFISKPVQLRSHVTLRLERGAVLKSTDNPADSRSAKGFIWAEDAEDIGIEGPGTIDGNGRVFEQRDSAPGRPRLLDLHNSRHVTVREVTLRNAGSWTCKLHGCDGVRIHAVRIHSHEGYNNGITLDNVHFTLRHPDARPALAFEDAHAVDLRNLRADPPTPAAPLLRFKSCSRVAVSGFRTMPPLEQFIHVEAGGPDALTLFGNDFTGVKRISNLPDATPR
jgi:polygalacturonase